MKFKFEKVRVSYSDGIVFNVRYVFTSNCAKVLSTSYSLLRKRNTVFSAGPELHFRPERGHVKFVPRQPA